MHLQTINNLQHILKMKRKYKLFFKYPIRLNAEGFKSLINKLPSDTDVLRRVIIQRQIKTKDPLILQLNDEEFKLFLKEFSQKTGNAKMGLPDTLVIDGTGIEVVKIQTI